MTTTSTTAAPLRPGSSDVRVEEPVASSVLHRCFGEAAGRIATEHWNTRPLIVRAADRAAAGGRADFDDLFSADAVDELLGPRALRTPFFTLVKDGKGLPRSTFTRTAVAGNQQLADLPDSDGIARAYADGATIVLQALHRTWPPLATFCRDLAGELGQQCQVNVYVTPPGAQGFKPHHDTHDVVVLQVTGRKHWTIHPPVIELPLKSQPTTVLGPDPAAGKTPVIDTVLEPGDALYLPRGWLHSARTADDRSIHLTVGVLGTTWADVLTDAVASAGPADLALRRVLPLPGQDQQSAVEEFRAAAARWVEGLSTDDVLRLVARRRGGAVPLEPVGPLAQDATARDLDPERRLRWRAGLRAQVSGAGDRVQLVLPDRSVSFPGWVGPTLDHLLTTRSVTAAELSGAVDDLEPEDALVLLRRLVRENALVPAAVATTAAPVPT